MPHADEKTDPTTSELSGLATDAENVVAAHDTAEQDIEKDDDLNSKEDPSADLDEGELARMDNNTDSTSA